MARARFIGFDIGTTTVKAMLFDEKGMPLDRYQAGYPTRFATGGIAEQEAADWIFHIDAALERFAAGNDLASLAAIGLTSQVNTHLLLDAAGTPLAPAIVWRDTRAGKEAAELDARIPEADKMHWWGAPMAIDASHALSRMEWMRRHRPKIWERTRWVMLPKDYCLYRLTGRIVSDPISNFGLIDKNSVPIGDLTALVPGAAERLPPLSGMATIAGTLVGHPSIGAPAVAVGTMDAWAGMFGVGALKPQSAFYLSGTSEVLGIVSDKVASVPGVIVFPPAEGVILHAGPTQSGAASLNWLGNLLKLSPDEMTGLAAATGNGSVPLFLPHLQGERAPIWDAEARGVFVGLDMQTDRGRLVRAVLEGVGFSARLVFESLSASAKARPSVLFGGGGGFRSDVWNQIRADILGLPIMRSRVADPGVLGAAGLAAFAAGEHGSLEEAFGALVGFDRRYEPDPAQKRRYNGVFELYKKTYRANREIGAELARFYSRKGD